MTQQRKSRSHTDRIQRMVILMYLPDLKMTADESTELQTIQVEVKNYINSCKGCIYYWNKEP